MGLACTSVPGAVTFVDVVPDTVMNTYNVQFNVDLDGNGFADVWFIRSSLTTSGLKAFSGGNVRVMALHSEGTTYDARAHSLGSWIGENAQAPYAWTTNSSGYYLASNLILAGDQVFQFGFFPGRDAFVGVELTLPDGVHYGFIQVRVPELSSIGYLKSYGFETQPGVPILAGAPEPGRLWLARAFQFS
jgi:hypothetical protein